MPRSCPVCRHENPNEARFCFNPDCRAPLDPEAAGGPVFQAGPPERALPAWAKVAIPVGVVSLLGVGAVVVAATRSTGDAAPVTVPSTAARATTTVLPSTTAPTTTTVKILGRPIAIASARASSTLPTDPRDGITYGIENTYDGKDTTAWNSNGSSGHVDPVGQKLTYTFATPQDVTAIRIRNGFNVINADRAWTDNYRVKEFVVRAGGKEFRLGAEDDPRPQSQGDLGLKGVTEVEIEILAVYDTTKWTDVAITEVEFFAAS